jgi:hypothetical protein
MNELWRSIGNTIALLSMLSAWIIFPLSAIAAAADATLVGTAEVTSPSDQGLRFELLAGRCGALGYTEWRDSEGLPVAREEILYDGDDDGAHWLRYRMERLAVGQDVLAERHGDFIRLDIREGARRREVRLKVKGQLLAGPMLITSLQSQLRELRRGKSIDINYLVAEQALVMGLRATRIAYGTDGFTNVRIEASSALLRPFVPTTLFIFDQDGYFIGMQGRLLPQKNRSSPLNGVVNVLYPLKPTASVISSCEIPNGS